MWPFFYLEVPTINSEKTFEFAIRSWNSGPNLLQEEPGMAAIQNMLIRFSTVFLQ